jgi:hypothetical protein
LERNFFDGRGPPALPPAQTFKFPRPKSVILSRHLPNPQTNKFSASFPPRLDIPKALSDFQFYIFAFGSFSVFLPYFVPYFILVEWIEISRDGYFNAEDGVKGAKNGVF